MTDYQTLTTKLAECQALAQKMADSGVWDELIWSTVESIDSAVIQLEDTHALTSDCKAIRARDDATDWRIAERKEAA